MMNTASYDGAKLRAILDEQGRRQTWLAAQLGVTVGMVNHVLQGRKPLRPKMAEAAAKALGVPLSFLAADIHNGIDSMPKEEVAA